MLIHELLGRNSPQNYGHLQQSALLPLHTGVGIELELEGLPAEPDVRYWRREQDGSLRDGIEYVFDGPLAGSAVVEAVQGMGRMLEDNRPNNSFRCSTHIHLDVQDLDFNRLELLVLAYLVNEGVFFDHCTTDRRYSNFCTPFFINSNLARQFVSSVLLMDEEQDKLGMLVNWPKYSSLNLKPITNYGSVEFRGSHAMTTEAELMGLVNRMLHLKRLALDFEGTPLEFVQHLRNLPLEDMFPTGLKEGYQPNELLTDQCYATALGVAARTLRAYGGAPRMRPVFVPPPRPRWVDVRVPLNREQLEAFHLLPQDSMLFSDLARLVKNLQSIQGLRRANLIEFSANNNVEDFGGRINLVEGLRAMDLLGVIY